MNTARVQFDAFKDDAFFMTAVNQNMSTSIQARGVILATGRFQGGGLYAKRGLIQETVFNLPVYQPGQRNKWYDLDFFNPAGHAVNQAGVETNKNYQPLDINHRPKYEHLSAAGTILAHNDWARLKAGSGVALVSAITTVNHFYKATEARK